MQHPGPAGPEPNNRRITAQQSKWLFRVRRFCIRIQKIMENMYE